MFRRAAFASASVVAPGIGSASANSAVSSDWQKYCDRNSSCRQTIVAPCFAASPMRLRAFFRFFAGSGEQVICTRPTTGFCVDFFLAMRFRLTTRITPRPAAGSDTRPYLP